MPEGDLPFPQFIEANKHKPRHHFHHLDSDVANIDEAHSFSENVHYL